MISIIIPVYNVEKYLRRCIDSILSQTYTDFEAILVDDGSTDESGKICDEYALKDSRIKVIHKKNGGVSAARNSGLDVAVGEYVAFCDSDDYLSADYLEVIFNSLKENNADCVVCNYTKVLENGEVVGGSNHASSVNKISTKSDAWEYIIKNIFGTQKHGWEACTRIFKNEIIQKNKIRFPTTCGNYAEDLAFVLNYSLYSSHVCSIDYSGYYYFLRDNSMMRRSASVIKLEQLNQVSFWFYPKFVEFFAGEKIESAYPIIHFLLLYTEYGKIIGTPNYFDLPKYINSLSQKEFYLIQTKKIRKCKKLLTQLYGKGNMRKIVLFSHYCLHQNSKRFSYESYIAYKFFIKK